MQRDGRLPTDPSRFFGGNDLTYSLSSFKERLARKKTLSRPGVSLAGKKLAEGAERPPATNPKPFLAIVVGWVTSCHQKTPLKAGNEACTALRVG